MTDIAAYAQPQDLRTHMGNKAVGFEDDATVTRALLTSTADVNAWCRRSFFKSDTEVTRIYYGDSTTGLAIDDAWSVTGLVVDGVTLDLADYDLLPLNGVKDGLEGWPVNEIRSQLVDGAAWFEGRCAVTLKPGWAVYPEPVVTATLMVAAEVLRSGDVPFGIAGMTDAGEAVRVGRLNPLVVGRLLPYQRAEEVVVG